MKLPGNMKALVVHEIMQPAHTWPLVNSMSNALFAQNCKNEEHVCHTRHTSSKVVILFALALSVIEQQPLKNSMV